MLALPKSCAVSLACILLATAGVPSSFLQAKHPRASRQPERAAGLVSRAVKAASADQSIVELDHGTIVNSTESILVDSALPPASTTQSIDACSGCGAQDMCVCNPFGYLLDWRRADLWAGMVGFSSGNFLPSGNRTAQVEGSFGFEQGLNFGSRMPSLLGGQLGAQVGLRLTQSQLNGTSAGEDSRTQAFVTAGLFRRVDYGLQGGLVVDYLRDDWVYQANLLQLRGELSFLCSPCHELGFRFSDSLQTEDSVAIIGAASSPLAVQLEALNTYRFFYRCNLGQHALSTAEFNIGFTDDSRAVLGLDLAVPLQHEVALQLGTNYVIPDSSLEDGTAYQQEAWNIGISFVWTPGRQAGTQRDYYRPLFRVADNNSLIAKLVN